METIPLNFAAVEDGPVTEEEIQATVLAYNAHKPAQERHPPGDETFWIVAGFPGDPYGHPRGGYAGVSLGYELDPETGRDCVRLLFPDRQEMTFTPHELFPSSREEFFRQGELLYAK